MGCFYLWLFLIFCIALFASVIVYWHTSPKNEITLSLRKQENINEEKENEEKENEDGDEETETEDPEHEKKMTAARMTVFFPVVLICCWFFPLVRRILIFFGDNVPFPILCLRVITSSVYGFCNSVVFVLAAWHYINS
ncbi:hypothetical protein RFI_27604 [Reticulomyxa filosa]|uniref:Uncharacterized protein n=1 Tax=Reticulomyxa filosa TaxID=46433 RepID=X6M805_RETFI|nr:hypothetical protein RFI_27604 [Reticulomyxa filosa]|eukprot:ETO09771.1 hypothetical protein RFI_27604 [Reticulomyxa filosa]